MEIQNQIAAGVASQIGAGGWIAITMMALGLAASSGLNTFLPLLMLAAAAKFHVFGMDLSGSFAWLESGTVLGVLALATIVEVAGDKIPVVDHALDAFGTIARPAAGTLAAASVFSGADPAMAAVLGLIVGAPVAFAFHAAKAGTRAASTTTTMGMANPVLSLLEDIAAFFITLVAFFSPFLVPLLLLVLLLVFWKMFKAARRLLTKDKQPGAGADKGSTPSVANRVQ